jgi:hypothetical protein
MPFFLTTIAASGISSSSPNDNSPVFLLCQLATKMNARLFRSCPPLPDLHFFFRFDPRLSLRPPLCGSDPRDDIVEWVLDDSDASDFRRSGEVSLSPRIQALAVWDVPPRQCRADRYLARLRSQQRSVAVRVHTLYIVSPWMRPNKVCLLVNSSARSSVKKNCDVLVFRLPLFAMPMRPRLRCQHAYARLCYIPVEPQPAVGLVLERLAIDAVSTCSRSRGISGLDDEAGDDSMEDDAVIVA